VTTVALSEGSSRRALQDRALRHLGDVPAHTAHAGRGGAGTPARQAGCTARASRASAQSAPREAFLLLVARLDDDPEGPRDRKKSECGAIATPAQSREIYPHSGLLRTRGVTIREGIPTSLDRTVKGVTLPLSL
jgi:hypothetical protein